MHSTLLKNLITLLPGLSLLLVILSFLNDIPCLIQKAPELGESGWMYDSLRGWGSAVPTASHRAFRNLNRWLSASTTSSFMVYLTLGFSPVTATENPGNMRLKIKWGKNFSWLDMTIIITLPSWSIDDHFSSSSTKFIPEIFPLQSDFNRTIRPHKFVSLLAWLCSSCSHCHSSDGRLVVYLHHGNGGLRGSLGRGRGRLGDSTTITVIAILGYWGKTAEVGWLRLNVTTLILQYYYYYNRTLNLNFEACNNPMNTIPAA